MMSRSLGQNRSAGGGQHIGGASAADDHRAAASKGKTFCLTGVFQNREGRTRGVWILCAAIMAYALVTYGIRVGLGAAFAALFDAWQINADNASLAPAWARMIYTWHGSILSAIQAVAVIAAGAGLRRLFQLHPNPPGSPRRAAIPLLAAAAGALLPVAAYVAFDSLRMTWPLTQPHFSLGFFVLTLTTFLSVLSGEYYTRGFVFEALQSHWGYGWAALAVILLFFMGSGGLGGSVLSGVNVMLLGSLLMVLYMHSGSLWAPFGLRFGWSAAVTLILGYGSGDSAIYRIYGVSENLLTGGDNGPMYGLTATLIGIVALACLLREPIARFIMKRHGDTSAGSQGRL